MQRAKGINPFIISPHWVKFRTWEWSSRSSRSYTITFSGTETEADRIDCQNVNWSICKHRLGHVYRGKKKNYVKFLAAICNSNHTMVQTNYIYMARRSQWPPGLRRGSAAARSWDCGFESRWGHGCLSVVIVVCCQVVVSASGWSLVQRGPTECGGSECYHEFSIMRRLNP